MTHFGKHIRSRREDLRKRDRRFSLRQVAQRIEVEPAYLSKIERGDVAPPSEATTLKLARDLGEDPDVLLALAEAGAEVIYPNPGFPIYESMIEFSGAKAVPMQLLEEEAYHPDLSRLPELVNERTRLLIINSPENPCGSVLTREELETIADVVRSHPDMYVMSDEIYKDILYSGEHHSIAALPGMADRTIILDGFSKSYAMTGWRLGYGIMPEELVPHISRLATNSVSCAASFSQIAGVAALDGPQDAVQEMAAEFARRRRLIADGLQAIPGINCPEPEGAFYAFPSIKETGLTSAATPTASIAVPTGMRRPSRTNSAAKPARPISILLIPGHS